jgi:hypothetical protein
LYDIPIENVKFDAPCVIVGEVSDGGPVAICADFGRCVGDGEDVVAVRREGYGLVFVE